MRPLLIWFGERRLVNCTVKENLMFAVGLGSSLECNRDLDPHLATFYILYLEIAMEWSELDRYGSPTNYVC
jgi:hypothetical protein